jgi:Flp pilus assembly pilin Flp
MLKPRINLSELFSSIDEREEGQTLTEYALILFLVSVVAVAALSGLATAIIGVLGQVVTAL